MSDNGKVVMAMLGFVCVVVFIDALLLVDLKTGVDRLIEAIPTVAP